MAQKVILVLSPGFLLQLHREPCVHEHGPDPSGTAVWIQPRGRFTGRGEITRLCPAGMGTVMDIHHVGLYAEL